MLKKKEKTFTKEGIGPAGEGRKTKRDKESFSQRVKEELLDRVRGRNLGEERERLRSVFLSAGSVTDPDKGYHLEFVFEEEGEAEELSALLSSLSVRSHRIRRKKYYVLYIKDSSTIVNLLGLMGAGRSLMEMENLRIVKEMRGAVNRRVNCETANIEKTVEAATRQMADIEYLRDHYGLDRLEDKLCDMARVRLQYPHLSLSELGSYLDPPVGKSGVNHRLRRLMELARRERDRSGTLGDG